MSARARIVELDKRYVWHPYTAMDEYVASVDPLVITRAAGARLYDADGRSYIDANSSWWCAALGHGHPRLVSALKRQADSLCHVSLAGVTHENAAMLAEELAAVAPGPLGHVFFSDDGSTALEAALKMAVQYWAQNGRPERTRFVALEGAFHGETLGVTALGGVEVFRRPFASVIMDCFRVPSAADGYERAFSAIERTLTSDADRIAAVVLEPVVQGAAGMRVYDPVFLRAVRELTSRHDVFLILDEVFTGFGRTGPMWAAEHAGVAPDILCSAKALTGGMLPLAATLTCSRVFEGFFGGGERTFFYGHTYAGNPLGAALAREVLAVYRDERILEQARPKAERIAKAFERMAELPGVTAFRAIGMIGALDLAGGAGYLERGGWRVYAEARKRGAYLRPLGNTVYVAPPLNIPDPDLDELLAIVEESLKTALRGE